MTTAVETEQQQSERLISEPLNATFFTDDWHQTDEEGKVLTGTLEVVQIPGNTTLLMRFTNFPEPFLTSQRVATFDKNIERLVVTDPKGGLFHVEATIRTEGTREIKHLAARPAPAGIFEEGWDAEEDAGGSDDEVEIGGRGR